ncbi:hypothetical protein GEMRC1_004354 [Eukaryota sp. GEM-RC1]
MHLLFALFIALCVAYRNEVIPDDVPPMILTTPPSAFIKSSDLPTNFDWSNVNGQNYLTVTRNQHIPQYCGSCWAHGSMVALFDRVRIQQGPLSTHITPSIQQIISCSKQYAGSCHGGSPGRLYQWLTKNYAVEESCFAYEATNDNWAGCRFGSCWDCRFNLQKPKSECYEVKNFTKYSVEEFGYISGEEQYMKEIFSRGPIAVGICANEDLEAFRGDGIFKDNTGQKCINHMYV